MSRQLSQGCRTCLPSEGEVRDGVFRKADDSNYRSRHATQMGQWIGQTKLWTLV